jgi:hypothetical protein
VLAGVGRAQEARELWLPTRYRREIGDCIAIEVEHVED